MTLRGWQATCPECQWNMHAVHREHADAAKRMHEESTGHRRVTVSPVAQSDSTSRSSGQESPPKAGGPV
ncbi:MAG TPA: hypothetical protein VGZ23_15915 [bacterium]|nr:hypothetical protein [bacterium]